MIDGGTKESVGVSLSKWNETVVDMYGNGNMSESSKKLTCW